MLRFDTVTIDPHFEPPRPALVPRRRVQTLHGAVGDRPEYIEDWGLEANTPIRFVSSPHQGFVTPAQVAALMALYEAGAAFVLETDLLKPLGGEPDSYIVRFDPAPGMRPVFPVAEPGGTLHMLDIALIVLGS